MKTNVDLNNKTILVTGSSGFIGFFLIKQLLDSFNNISIIGIDNMNDYYDVKLKEYRLNILKKYSNYTFIKGSISDKELINKIFKKNKINIVVNLAAQVGVRYSIANPDIYIESNIVGFYNILEACRNNNIEHLVFASSSSVYGDNIKTPYSVEDRVDNPVSLYAATKKSNEVLAYSYSKLYNIPITGLRFFTVYGPLGRPDMAYFNFTNKLVNKEKIKIFNYGKCKRDFTYIDDIVDGIIKVINKPSKKDVPYNIYNLGNSSPVSLLDFINILQEELIRAKVLPKDYDFDILKELVPMQKGDVAETFADISLSKKDFGFNPKTSLKDGLREFVKWYKDYYKN